MVLYFAGTPVTSVRTVESDEILAFEEFLPEKIELHLQKKSREPYKRPTVRKRARGLGEICYRGLTLLFFTKSPILFEDAVYTFEPKAKQVRQATRGYNYLSASLTNAFYIKYKRSPRLFFGKNYRHVVKELQNVLNDRFGGKMEDFVAFFFSQDFSWTKTGLPFVTQTLGERTLETFSQTLQFLPRADALVARIYKQYGVGLNPYDPNLLPVLRNGKENNFIEFLRSCGVFKKEDLPRLLKLFRFK